MGVLKVIGFLVVKVSAIVDFTAGLPPGSPVAINYDNISVNGKGSTKKTYLFPTFLQSSKVFFLASKYALEAILATTSHSLLPK